MADVADRQAQSWQDGEDYAAWNKNVKKLRVAVRAVFVDAAEGSRSSSCGWARRHDFFSSGPPDFAAFARGAIGIRSRMPTDLCNRRMSNPWARRN